MKKTLLVLGTLTVLVILAIYFLPITFSTGNSKVELDIGKNPAPLTDKKTVLIPVDSGVDISPLVNINGHYQINLPSNWNRSTLTTSGDLVAHDTFEPSDKTKRGQFMEVLVFTYEAYTKDGSRISNKEIVGHELNALRQGTFPGMENVHVYQSKVETNDYAANFSFTDKGQTYNVICRFVFGASLYHEIIAVVPANINQQDYSAIQTSVSSFRN